MATHWPAPIGPKRRFDWRSVNSRAAIVQKATWPRLTAIWKRTGKTKVTGRPPPNVSANQ